MKPWELICTSQFSGRDLQWFIFQQQQQKPLDYVIKEEAPGT